MSAETLGADLLREVKEEGLDDVRRNIQDFVPAEAPYILFADTDRLVASTFFTRPGSTIRIAARVSSSRQNYQCLPKPSNHAATAAIPYAVVD